jgi:hypothetical protein
MRCARSTLQIHACNERGVSLVSASIIIGLIPYKNQFVVIESGKLNSIGGEKKKNTGRAHSHPVWQPSHSEGVSKTRYLHEVSELAKFKSLESNWLKVLTFTQQFNRRCRECAGRRKSGFSVNLT